jgi:hypothetical protein
MILIVTHKQDYTADFVIAKLNEIGIAYFRFNCEDYLDYNISIQFGYDSQVVINNIAEFSAVWYRRTKLPEIVAPNESERLYILGEIDTFINNLFGIIPAKWLSAPVSVDAAENKLFQLKLAQAIGLRIPRTLVTNSKNELRAFATSNKSTIIKPIGRGRIQYPEDKAKLIFTNEFSAEILREIDQYLLTPAIFQEGIEKDYEIRVTVVGSQVFAAKINSQDHEATRLDWRRSPLKFEAYDLPALITDKCLLMLNKLNIEFGAFDFIKSKTGEYYFLEVNPNGQWVWIEKDTGLKISEAIINFLT